MFDYCLWSKLEIAMLFLLGCPIISEAFFRAGSEKGPFYKLVTRIYGDKEKFTIAV